MTDSMTHLLVLKDLAQRKATRFALSPDSDALAALAAQLDLSALRKLRFEGALRPGPGADWTLEAHLGATLVQPCGVTLDPVTTRLEEPVTRRYLANWQTPEEAEREMLDDEEAEPLPATLDLAQVMIEALALAIPAFPRSDAAALAISAAPKGAAPLSDDAVKPFAGLADLRAQMGQPPKDPETE